MSSLGIRDKIWWRKRKNSTGDGWDAFTKVGAGKDERFVSLCGAFEVKKLNELLPKIHSQKVCRPKIEDRCCLCDLGEIKVRKAKTSFPPSSGRC